MGKRSRLGDEPASAWVARIHAFQRMWERRRPEVDRYRDALEMKWGRLLPSADFDAPPGVDVSSIDQIPLNISRRYVDRLQALATDDEPLLYYPRDAEGDEEYASFVERLLTRSVYESGYIREFRSGITDLSAAGSTAMWFGFHADVLTRDQAKEIAKPAGDVMQEVLSGQHKPAAGQDHLLIAEALSRAGSDPITAAGPGGSEIVMAAGMAASGHIQAAMDEAKDPDIVWAQARSVWARWLPVGTWTCWDPTVFDLRDARWMARKVVMTLDEAKSCPAFNPRVRGKIGVTPRPKGETEERSRAYTEPGAGPVDDLACDEVVVWEVWDKRYRTRHYVSVGMDEYLEADEAYPYMDDETGEPLVPGFFPCVVTAPLQHATEKPERTLGLPLIAPGFPQQIELIKLRSYAMAVAKRYARVIEVAEEASDEDIQALAIGRDGVIMRRPQGLEHGKDFIKIHQFSGDFPALRAEMGLVLSEWCAIQEFPMAELTTQPVADTATQEQIGISGGSQRTSFVIRQLEADFARGVEIIRGIVRGFYTPEKVAGMVGGKSLKHWEAWRKSSMDGDRMRVRFAGRAKQENSVQTKQSMDLLMLLRQEIGPMGFPKYKTDHLLEDIARGLGYTLVPYQPSQQEMMMAMMAAQGGGGPGGPPGQGGPPGRGDDGRKGGIPGRGERAEKPPTQGNIQAGASRVGPR